MTTQNTLFSASQTSRPSRSVRVGKTSDEAYLVHLQKRWAHNVGFLPRQALARYLRLGQVLLVDENNWQAGYLIWTWKPSGLVRLPQVAIEPEMLRTTLGTKIMNAVIRSAKRHHCSVVRLTSRSDLPANQFWPLFGFQPTAVTAKPTTRGLPLIEWTLQLTDAAAIAHILATDGRPFRLGKAPPPTAPFDAGSQRDAEG